MDTEEKQLVCRRDGAATKLRCAKCEVGICPVCLVRTAVGYKCSGCAGERVATQGRNGPGRLIVGGAVVLTLLAGFLLLGTSDESMPDPVGAEAATEGPVAAGQVMIGEEARDGQLVFVVERFACNRKPSTGSVGSLGGGQICTLGFSVKNASSSPATFLGRFQYLVDPQSRTHGADDALTRAAPENDNRSVTELHINPDVVVPLVFVFDLPEAVEPTEAQFRGTGRSRLGVSVRLERRG